MGKLTVDCFYGEEADDLFYVRPRSYKRPMKPLLPRKATSAARINLNRFWNELEDFYGRYEERRAKNNNNCLMEPLPDYTTDTFDHAREEAENNLNEALERQFEKPTTVLNNSKNLSPSGVSERQSLLRLRLQSADVHDDAESVFEDDDDVNSYEGDLWVEEVDKLPSPPTDSPFTLKHLVSFMAKELD